MIYLKHINGQVKEYKDHDTKTTDFLVDSGKWERVTGIKDWTPYKKVVKKINKKTNKKK